MYDKYYWWTHLVNYEMQGCPCLGPGGKDIGPWLRRAVTDKELACSAEEGLGDIPGKAAMVPSMRPEVPAVQWQLPL